jgi:hypothetical protein
VLTKFFTIILLGTCNVACWSVEISSNEPIEYVVDTDELVVKGDAKIAMGNFIIQADEITFEKE